MDTDVANVGAENPARLLDLSSNRVQTSYQPGYVIDGGYVILGTTEDALEDVVAVLNGEDPPLSSNEEHRRVMDLLPDDPALLLWIDLNTVADEIELDEGQMTRDQYRLLRRAAGALAVAEYQERETYKVKVAVTLLPE